MSGAGTPFAFERAEDSPGFLLWQLTNLWQQAVHAALTPFGLTHVQFVLLASLAWLERVEGCVCQADLARHAHTDPMMTSQVLRVMEEKGLCHREPHPTDARARRLVLTENGRRLAETCVPQVEAVDRRFFAELGEGSPAFSAAMRALVQRNSNR